MTRIMHHAYFLWHASCIYYKRLYNYMTTWTMMPFSLTASHILYLNSSFTNARLVSFDLELYFYFLIYTPIIYKYNSDIHKYMINIIQIYKYKSKYSSNLHKYRWSFYKGWSYNGTFQQWELIENDDNLKYFIFFY